MRMSSTNQWQDEDLYLSLLSPDAKRRFENQSVVEMGGLILFAATLDRHPVALDPIGVQKPGYMHRNMPPNELRSTSKRPRKRVDRVLREVWAQAITPGKSQILICMAVLTLACCGCVQRRLIVRSQPEGAFVQIDGQQIGYTPVSVPFTYYGTRDIQLEKDGFKTVKVQQRVRPPWYARFPVSFFSENFSPREIHDERLLDFQMEPKTEVQENLLLDRANGLRGDVQRGTVTAPIK